MIAAILPAIRRIRVARAQISGKNTLCGRWVAAEVSFQVHRIMSGRPLARSPYRARRRPSSAAQRLRLAAIPEISAVTVVGGCRFGEAAVLVRQEEEKLVLDERAAEGPAELVKAQCLSRSASLVGEEVVGVEDNRYGRSTSRCRDTGWSLTW